MKKLNWLTIVSVLAMLCLGFSACGDPDDNDGGGGNSGLVGTWKRDLGSGSSETLTLGSDGSYNSRTYDPAMTIGGKWYPSSTQIRKGSYSYNDANKLMVVNIIEASGSNRAYTITYLVHTLEATKLVLIDTSYGDTYYYSR